MAMTRRRLMDMGLGGAGLALSTLLAGRAFGLSLQPLEGEVESLYREACQADTDHTAIVETLLQAARRHDVAVDEPALRRLLAGRACPVCGCPLLVG